jgi:nicotinate-nucleotide adenylyltransferase
VPLRLGLFASVRRFALESGMRKKLPRPKAHWLKPPGPVADGLKIGLLGGSFNPAHEGHLYVSETALKQLGLDYVWWLVAPQNPLKPVCGMAPLQGRLAYAADKFENHPRIVVVDLERTIGTRYTVDTVRALKRRFPRVHFVWLMGSDNLENFRRWRRWPEIVRSVPIGIVMRPGYSLAPLYAKPMQRFAAARVTDLRKLAMSNPPAIAVLDGRRCLQSATAIRAQNLRGEGLVRVVPTC